MKKGTNRQYAGPANGITCGRMLLSLILLFLPAFSIGFTAVYLLAGVTDMLDGWVARKTGAVTAFGAKLDTAADVCFFCAAAYRILPAVRLPVGIRIWILLIAGIKAVSLISSLLLKKGMPSVHSRLNKSTGLLLFLFPLTVPYTDSILVPIILCAFATAAALQEGRTVRTSGGGKPGGVPSERKALKETENGL